MRCSPKLSCPVNGLPDSVLTEIFKRLPPYERLLVSEVCRRWLGISRKAWVDVSTIDLQPIPGKHIGAIVNQCSMLQSVVAVNKTFDANELACLAKVPSLKRVRFIRCDFKLKPDVASIEQSIFSDSLGYASWTEFILHGADFFAPQITPDACGVHLGTAFLFSVANLPASLTHLQLSGVCLCEEFLSESSLVLDGLERLENLECFILHWTPYRRYLFGSHNPGRELIWTALMKPNVSETLLRLKNLKELCLGPALWLGDQWLLDLESSLPKLQVLFLTYVHGTNIAEDLATLITSNSTLRVLVLSGQFCVFDDPIELPARKRFPHGFGSDPLPLLHVFVGREASEKIRFIKSASDAAVIHPINEPMPEFIEREDIAPIFKNVWVTEKIKEMTKHGDELWKYATHDSASHIQHI